MKITINSMKEDRLFTPEEAMQFITDAKTKFLIASDIASYLVGFKWIEKEGERVLVPRSDLDVSNPVCPRLKGLEIFPQIIEKLKYYPANVIEGRNKKDEDRLSGIAVPIYKHQDIVSSVWRDVDIDYFMASNDVIYEELLVDFAVFIATLEEFRKFATLKAKQDPRVRAFYEDAFDGYKPKEDWFVFIIDEILTLSKGFESIYSEVPEDTSEWKTLFWNAHKKQRAIVRKRIL